MLPEDLAFQKHFRIGELARMWGIGRESVRRLVMVEPDVLKLRMGRKRAHTFYSIPEAVARRIHAKLLNPEE